jgi:hypothetical protein
LLIGSAEFNSSLKRTLIVLEALVAQKFQRLVLKVMTVTVALSTFGLANARADIDPALCGLGGGLAGGAVGNQFGGGNGKVAMTLFGAIAGAVIAGNACKRADNSDDIRYARQNERQMLMNGGGESYEWSNPRYGQHQNAHSHVERRGWYGQRECTMTRSIMQSSDGGRYVNETYWCNDRGNWSQVTETTTIQQIDWTAQGPVQSTTTQTTTTYSGGQPSMRQPMPPQVPAPWIISENQVERIHSEFEREWAHPERAALEAAGDLARGRQFMTLDQLGRLLKELRFDRDRQQVLSVLAPVVDQQFGSMSSVTSAYDFDRQGDEARRLLDQVRRDQQASPRRDEHWGHDRGGRPDFGRDRGDDRRGDWRRP